MSLHRMLIRAGVVLGDQKTIIGYNEPTCHLCDREGISGPLAGIHHRQHMLGGDALRVIRDTLDDWHVAAYAELSGATPDQVRKLFELFFADCNHGPCVHSKVFDLREADGSAGGGR